MAGGRRRWSRRSCCTCTATGEKLADSDMNAFPAPERIFSTTPLSPICGRECFGSTNFFSLAGAAGRQRFSQGQDPQPHDRRQRRKPAALCRPGRGRPAPGRYSRSTSSRCWSAGRSPRPSPTYLAGNGVEWPGALIPLVGKPLLAGDSRTLLVDSAGTARPVPRLAADQGKIQAGAFRCAHSAGNLPGARGRSRRGGLCRGRPAEARVPGSGRPGSRSLSGGTAAASELRYRPGRESLLWSGAGGGGRLPLRRKDHRPWQHRDPSNRRGRRRSRPNRGSRSWPPGRLVVSHGAGGENLDLQKAQFAQPAADDQQPDFFGDERSNADIVLAATDGGTVQAQVVAAGSVVSTGTALLKITRRPDRRRYPEFGAPAGRCPGGAVRFRDRVQLQNFQVACRISASISSRRTTMNKKGLTVVELLVTVSLLALLRHGRGPGAAVVFLPAGDRRRPAHRDRRAEHGPLPGHPRQPAGAGRGRPGRPAPQRGRRPGLAGDP